MTINALESIRILNEKTGACPDCGRELEFGECPDCGPVKADEEVSELGGEEPDEESYIE